MSNISKCSVSKGYAAMEAIQDDKRKYTKYPKIAPQFEDIPPLDKSYIINNRASLPQSSLHRIASECVPIFHETYKKTKEDISQIIGRLTQNSQISDYTTPKTNIAIGHSQIIKENNPYSVSNFGNFPLERLYTDAENLTHIPQQYGFFKKIINNLSIDFILPWNKIAGKDIFKYTEDYLLKQENEKQQKPDIKKNEQKDLYREAFGLSQPAITPHIIPTDATNNSVPISQPHTVQPIEDVLYPQTTSSDIMNSAVRTIQNGATTVLKNTRYIGQTLLKDTQSLGHLAVAHPLATTMIGLGTAGLLYRNFKKKNEQDTEGTEK